MSRANTVFVAPFALPSTLRFLRAAALLPDTTFSVVAQEPAASFMAALDEEVRDRIADIVSVADCHDPHQLEGAVRRVAASTGSEVTALVGILEPLQEALASVRERLQIRGMDRAEAGRFRDKAVMKDALRAHDLPCAGHHLATDAASALSFARGTMPLVAKPPAGAGARDTFRVDEVAQLESWMGSNPPSPQRPLLLEEFVQGREFSFDSVSVGGRHLFHSISEYSPTPLQVMESPWIQWTVMLPRDISGPEYAPILSAGPRALDALGMVSGMTHMEWFRRADGSIAISEVAARPPGAQFTSLISYAHDRDFYRVWAEVSILEEFTPPPRRYATGAAYLRGQGGGRVARVAGIERANEELGDLVVESQLPAPGQPKASSYEGEGFIILRHEDTDRVREGLRRAVEILQVELSS
ncbi:hypothetical protein N9Z54_01330 [Planctomycetota bacterium]|nr:hypothetical protein [bacterium]MDB2575821.1 hypothetical protein [Planctomycetota bacterium]